MMTVEEMKAKKKALGLSNAKIAELSGLPLGTVQKVFSGETKAPRYKTLAAIEAVLQSAGHRMETGAKVAEEVFAYQISEKDARLPADKRQGEFTLEDYYNMPEDWRGELIDGCLYQLNAPSLPHQHYAAMMYHETMKCKEEHGMSCWPFMSPAGVQLDRDEKTFLLPDFLIVCDPEKVIRRCVYGAPDFVAEVLSPSTRKRDRTLKAYKYANAGVREYWMIDEDGGTVVVYDFEHDAPTKIYSIHDEVPIGISDGLCVIDFGKFTDQIKGFVSETPPPGWE